MKIRSRRLYEYLLHSGVLTGTPEDIAIAKRAYRRKYKREWKRKKLPAKELRPSFTPKEYEVLKQVARKAGFKNPTAYVKQLTRASLAERPFLPNKEELSQALQYVSMVLTWMIRDEMEMNKKLMEEYLSLAERILLTCVRDGH